MKSAPMLTTQSCNTVGTKSKNSTSVENVGLVSGDGVAHIDHVDLESDHEKSTHVDRSSLVKLLLYKHHAELLQRSNDSMLEAWTFQEW